MNVIQLISHLRSLPPESDVITVEIDPTMENPPEIALANMYTINPAQGIFKIQPKDPFVFIGSDAEYEFILDVMNS
jgi:hypothetical protein